MRMPMKKEKARKKRISEAMTSFQCSLRKVAIWCFTRWKQRAETIIQKTRTSVVAQAAFCHQPTLAPSQVP